MEQHIEQLNEAHRIRMEFTHMIAKRNGGVEWPLGWNSVVRKIFELCASNGYKIAVVQVKEKFGGLRFYYDALDGRNKEVDDAISALESSAYSMCQVCGEPGEQRGGGWIRTLCEKHAAEKRVDWWDVPVVRKVLEDQDQEFYLRLREFGCDGIR